MLEEILILTVIVVLPIIPAFILYKFLPSKASAKGPFKGLNIQLKGAFAGYFIVLLFIGGFFLMFSAREATYDFGTVTGYLKLDQGQFDEKDIIITVTPPMQTILPNGKFTIEKVLVPKYEGIEKPYLLIYKAGYEVETVTLEEKFMEIPGIPDYQIEYSKTKKNLKKINIKKPIILRKEVKRGKYSEETGVAAAPVD